LCFSTPRKTLRLAGQEHGRAIPLADIAAQLFNHLVSAPEQRDRENKLPAAC
jgi:hypothetical protein